MISFVTTGRSDDYGGEDYIKRFKNTTQKNLEVISKLGFDYEYIIVEWNPYKNYLCDDPHFSSLFLDYPKLVDIIIPESVVIKESLSIDIYYEYFAKNAGVRYSKFEYLILLNSDIIIPESCMIKILDLINNFKEKYYYRPRYSHQVGKDLSFIRESDLTEPDRPHSYISGHSGGDFLLARTSDIINYAQGYDETNLGHRKPAKQHHMDTEIMYNMHFSGCQLEYLDDIYLHIAHGHGNTEFDQTMNFNGYENKPNWGFTDYEKSFERSNLIIIQ